MLTKRAQALAAALALLLGANPSALPAKPHCAARCKAPARPHKMRRPAYGEGRVLEESVPPAPWPRSPEAPLPTLPERRYQPGVAPPSPFLPNDLPSTFLPQKL